MVLITGISGFIGSNLNKYLTDEEIEVLGASRFPKNNQITYSQINKKIIDSTFCIIHLAGIAHDIHKTNNIDNYFESNFELTKVLFDKFLKSNSKLFIFMSSVKAVADSVQGELDESASPNPKSPYGKSKLAAENYLRSKQLKKNQRLIILRPCMVYGPGNKGNLNLLYSYFSLKLPWFLGEFKNKRSYCSLFNLLFVIKEIILNKNITSGIYNIADDNPLSTNEVVEIISTSINKKILILNIPKNLINFLAKVGDKIPIFFNSEKLQKLTESYVVKNNKIKNIIGKPLPENSKLGLLRTFESYNSIKN